MNKFKKKKKNEIPYNDGNKVNHNNILKKIFKKKAQNTFCFFEFLCLQEINKP